MRPHPQPLPQRLLPLLAGILILKVTISVVSNYPNYIPPNFSSDFLRGRQPHFFGLYSWAFYTHILSGPLTLIIGLFLVTPASRTRFPTWHRLLGRLQIALILFLVSPSGLIMSFHAAAGPLAGLGLATLALLTALCAFLGLRSALSLRFADHRLWMCRCYLLLCSAVVIRLIGGFATVTALNPPWLDPLSPWISWLLPLSAFELRHRLLLRQTLIGLPQLSSFRVARTTCCPGGEATRGPRVTET
jgi:hypothetical protein